MNKIFIRINGIGFTFLLDEKVKCNLISPAFMSFFNIERRLYYSLSIDNSIEVNSKSVYNDDLPFLPEYLNEVNFDNIFRYVGKKVTRCNDNKFRKCKVFIVGFEYEGCSFSFSFLLDKNLSELAVLSKESLKQIKCIADVKTY